MGCPKIPEQRRFPYRRRKEKKVSRFKRKTVPPKKKPPVTKPAQKSVKEMSDEELRSKIARLELERRYSSLNPQKVSVGKRIFDDVLVPVAKDASKRLLTDFAINQGKKLMGLNDKNDNSLAGLEKTVKELELKDKYRKYTQNND